jgi:putative SOS response-associated peptidase YedK
MCNVYGPAGPRMVTERFDAPFAAFEDYKPGLGPWSHGPYVRRRDGRREAVVGQWALIGDKDRQAVSRPRMTNNARWEELASKPTFRGPWARGQRCLIPADWYQEPNWESGKNVWWRFARADGDCWALAGLWNDWTDPATGEIHSSYTMLTLNCDGHPLLARMHKPDPKLPDDKQDKRTVVPLEPADWERWLTGTVEEADQLRRVPALEIYDAGPVNGAGG